jgi:hypothetical protein
MLEHAQTASWQVSSPLKQDHLEVFFPVPRIVWDDASSMGCNSLNISGLLCKRKHVKLIWQSISKPEAWWAG